MTGNGNGSAGAGVSTRFGKLKARIGMDDTLAGDGACLVLDESAGVKWWLRSAQSVRGQRITHDLVMLAMDNAPGGMAGTDFESSVATDVQIVAALLSRWEGMTDDDGQDVAPSVEAVAEAFQAFPEWRPRVLAFARNPKNYRLPSARTLEKIEGNSAHASAPG